MRFTFVFFFLSFHSAWAEPIMSRKVEVKKDELVTVRTAMGVATIIQVPDEPQSLVLGDQSKFKVEYLNQAITIKPLSIHATTNLYIFTAYDRFSVKLVTGNQPRADFVVYIKRKAMDVKSNSASSFVRWKIFGISKSVNGATLTLKRLGKTSEEILIDLEVKAEKPRQIDPSIFWISQNHKTRPIQELRLSQTRLKSQESAQIEIVVLKRDLFKNPMLIEVRGKKPVEFLIPHGDIL